MREKQYLAEKIADFDFLRDNVGALQMGSVQKSRWGRMCAIFPI